VAADSIEASRKNKLVTAGFFVDQHGFAAVANSNGILVTRETAMSASPARRALRMDAALAGSAGRPPM